MADLHLFFSFLLFLFPQFFQVFVKEETCRGYIYIDILPHGETVRCGKGTTKPRCSINLFPGGKIGLEDCTGLGGNLRGGVP